MLNLKTFPSVQAALRTLDSFSEPPPFDLWFNPVLERLLELSGSCCDHGDLHDAALEKVDPDVVHVPDGRCIENAGISTDAQLWVQSRLYMLNGFHDECTYTEAVCGLVVDRNDTNCEATVFFGIDWKPKRVAFGRLLFCDPEEREPEIANDHTNWRFAVTEKIEHPGTL